MKTTPTCAECGNVLKPYTYFGHQEIDPEHKKQFGYDGNGIFCTLRCGYRWALNTIQLKKITL